MTYEIRETQQQPHQPQPLEQELVYKHRHCASYRRRQRSLWFPSFLGIGPLPQENCCSSLKPGPRSPWAPFCCPHMDTAPWEAPLLGPACSCWFAKSSLSSPFLNWSLSRGPRRPSKMVVLREELAHGSQALFSGTPLCGVAFCSMHLPQ